MCISNDVGGQYMSNALWEGIPLVDLLQRAGVKTGATKIVFHAADDYTDSIHLTKALEPTTLLAVQMNGDTLPQEHGFPARMLVPGIYGMKHCKWLTRIEVVNYDYQGYWQQRGWSDAAPVRMTSRIDTPLTGSSTKVNQTTYIAGVAFSGNKGISEVDVSTDAGQNWQRAILKQPLSGLTWVLWELAWQPSKADSYTIVVRAIDLEGNVQDPNEEPPLAEWVIRLPLHCLKRFINKAGYFSAQSRWFSARGFFKLEIWGPVVVSLDARPLAAKEATDSAIRSKTCYKKCPV